MPHVIVHFHRDGYARHTDAKGYVTMYLLSLQVVRNLPGLTPARGLRFILGPLELGVSWA